MSRMVKEFAEIKDYTSLDQLIESLVKLRESIPAVAEAEVKLRGDDFFGRQLTVTYFRRQTAEEAQCEARYANAYRESRQRELYRLQEEVGGESRAPRGRGRKLRIVA